MPLHNGDPMAVPQAARPRRTPIVPAIPLALSKPRPKFARPQPNAEMATTPLVKQEKPAEETLRASEKKETSETEHVSVQVDDATPLDLPTNHQLRGGDYDVHSSISPARSERNEITAVMNGTPSGSLQNEALERLTPATDGVGEVPSPTVKASPLSARRDKVDIRQIRTELPPAFVPFADQHTPHSARSAASSQNRQYQRLPHGHPIHPSASSIVFGGHDSSTSSPAPPLSAGSAYAPPAYPTQPPYVSHNHHTSEPQAQRMHQPPYPQAPPHWGGRSYAGPGPQVFYHPHAHIPFRYPPRDLFGPNSPAQNGFGPRSRSGSHTSSGPQDGPRPGNDLRSPAGSEQPDSAKAFYPDPKLAGFAAQHGHVPSQQIPPPPPAFPHPDLATAMDNASAMRDHVHSQWLRPELADCHLQVVEAESNEQTYIDGHKLILSRSPTLLALIRSAVPSEAAPLKTPVRVELKGPYIRTVQFSECVRYLYGGPLPRFDFYRSLESSEERMRSALGFIATGAWLGIPAIAHQSVEIAASFLQWDTYSIALAFALDGGLDQAWPIGDGSEERVSTCSSDDSFSKPEAGGAPTYDPYSTGLLHRIVEFTVQNLPPNFYLDQSAPPLEICARLPAFKMKHESKSSRSDPRLSKIRFGEIPVEDHQRPSPITTTISSILLSLPFPLLKYLLEHPLLSSRLGPETVGSIMRQVVHEREVRRQKALQSRTLGNDVGEAQQVQNLYWVEAVEQSSQHRAGFRLARRRRGIDTPPSSGAESEQVK